MRRSAANHIASAIEGKADWFLDMMEAGGLG